MTSHNKVFFHYNLVAGMILFRMNEEAPLEEVTLNTQLKLSRERITAADIGRAQQALQITLFRNIGGPALVSNVVITNIMPLGRMTEDQFMAGLEELTNGQ